MSYCSAHQNQEDPNCRICYPVDHASLMYEKARVAFHFYGGHCFSNYWVSPIVVNGYHYATVEHFYQAMKATNLDDFYHIKSAPTPGQSKKRARGIKLRQDWEEVKFSIMLDGLRAKFAIPEFRKVLLETGDAEIREDSPTDFIWGWRNGGQNLLGKALMQVRKEIRDDFGRLP